MNIDRKNLSKEQMIEKIYQEIANEYEDFNEVASIYQTFQTPVMIGDVFDYIEKDKSINSREFEISLSNIYNLWQQKRLPIENQSEECITYIYNLLFNK